MRYIIVGCGRVGSNLAKLLVAEKHDVMVVDENPSSFKRLGNRFEGRVEVGTGIDYDVLKRAGGERADGFVAVTDGDNRNIMAALIAQRLFHIQNIVAASTTRRAGRCTANSGSRRSARRRSALRSSATALSTPRIDQRAFDFGKVSSFAVTVPAALSGKTVAEVEQAGTIRIAAIRRGAFVSVASPNDPLSAGDEINAVVAPQALVEFTTLFSGAPAAAVA